MNVKQILPNILLLFLSITLSLFIIEMVARQLGREHFIQNNVYILTDHSVFSYKPNNEYTIKRQEFNNTVRVNSKGLIDYEYKYNKPIGTKRIIMLGDSFIAGQELPLEKTITKKLEKMLNKNSEKYEVINMGFGGFGPTAEAVLLEKEGIKYNPDMVILNLFIGNDFVKIDFGVSGSIPKEMFENSSSIENVDFKVTKIQKLKNFIFRNYFTYTYVKKLVSSIGFQLTGNEDYDELDIYNKQYLESTEKGLEKLKIILKHLKRYTDEKSIKFLVVLIPTKQQVDDGKFSEMVRQNKLDKSDLEINRGQKILLQFGKENDIIMLDLLPAFSKRNKNNTFYFDIDGHWNEKGHELAAILIYETLINGGVLLER